MPRTVAATHALGRIYETKAVAVTALDRVDLQLAEGDFVSIVGPSGSGKSTLLHILGGLDKPTSGQVEIDGINLGSLSESGLADLRLQKLGFVFQAYNLLPVLSALENVEFILQLQGIAKTPRRARAIQALRSLGLGDLLDRRPGDMSGGQQQRVAIARAIVTDPVLLLADEPSANLDSKTTEELCELLKRINDERGVTVVTATHDPVVMSFASRRIELRDGQVL